MRSDRPFVRAALLKALYTCVIAFATASGVYAQWTVINLHPAGATQSEAYGIFDGQQVGMCIVGSNAHASLWSGSAGSWVDLHPAGATSSEAHGVGGGQQVGYGAVGGVYRAFLWSGTPGSVVDLSPPWSTFSRAFGVSGGQQAGETSADGSVRASLWTGSAASWVDLTPAVAAGAVLLGISEGKQVGVAFVGSTACASLWSGTAASWVNLHPAVATDSEVLGVGGGQQVGHASVGGYAHASLWSGTSASWVDLHPAVASESRAVGANGGQQVGYATVDDARRASLWSGTAASWADLHAFLPASYLWSQATGIWRDAAGVTYIVGYGNNTATGRVEALMWRSPVGPYTLRVRSANPATGIPMTVWTPDINGLKNASTSFDRIYNAGTNASITAPLSVGTQWFDRWEKDGSIMPGPHRTITVAMDAHHTIKAIYAMRTTLTVASQNPNAGVPISVWTADKNGLTSGSTQFIRTYSQGTTVSLTAPSVVGNSSFRRWNLDGAPWQSTRTVSLPMGADHTLTAVYVAGQTLTVNSTTTSVPVTVWNTDIFGRRNGTTNFTRVYATGGTASVTVPAQVGGKPFVRWEKDGVAVPGTSRTVTVTMDAGHTINAVYAP